MCCQVILQEGYNHILPTVYQCLFTTVLSIKSSFKIFPNLRDLNSTSWYLSKFFLITNNVKHYFIYLLSPGYLSFKIVCTYPLKRRLLRTYWTNLLTFTNIHYCKHINLSILCVRKHSKCFIHIISFNHHNSNMKEVLGIYLQMKEIKG